MSKLVLILIYLPLILADIKILSKHNLSEMALGLSEIVKGMQTPTITVLDQAQFVSTKTNEFVHEVHKMNLKTCMFTDTNKFYKFVSDNLKGSLEVTSLILSEPAEILEEIHKRDLAHRLVLFMFYWGAKQLPDYSNWNLREPLRIIFITNPRKKVYRVYYNQASSANENKLKLVNWYNGNDIGLATEPLLRNASRSYKNFHGRTFYVPVIHSPPWFFVSYSNSSDKTDNTTIYDSFAYEENSTGPTFVVTGGRDDTLLKVLSKKMNFLFEYVDPPERTQGVTQGTLDNISFTGGLGMLQRREADFVLGDMVISYERMQEVEFSFFTLADSGAFVTHAPRHLSETLTIIRSFSWNVWPLLVFTIIMSGPVLYAIIIAPISIKRQIQKRYFAKPSSFHHITYIKEITIHGHGRENRILLRRRRISPDYQVVSNLLNKCIWFTVNVYLKQSLDPPHDSNRARFFVILLWFSATYVLSDLYSAELTSQLARPKKEAPIDTLLKLKQALDHDDSYRLFVERESAFYDSLKNGSGLMRQLFNEMTSQGDNSTYLITSIEEGVRSIVYDTTNVVFGGRETLFFNTKRFGTHNFQLSEKLYTRYSAISLQKGCLFLDDLNENIMRLFEGGILEKITNDEYETMYKNVKSDDYNDESANNEGKKITSKSDQNVNGKLSKSESNSTLKPITLKMLKGAFLLLAIGYLSAFVSMLIERQMQKPPWEFPRIVKKSACNSWSFSKRKILICLTHLKKIILDIFQF